MENDKKITIIDVAKRAGVSKGTVDRVLHNRGEVSAKSAEKVRKAIRELEYEPNLYASLLATRQERVIACLFPRSEKGEYWQKLLDGFVRGGESASNLSIRTEVFLYDQYSPDSFRETSDQLLESNPSGVVLTPLFRTHTIEFVSRLQASGIPYVYVDTRLEDENYLAYFGMPMFKSGRLCARMLTDRFSQEQIEEVLMVRLVRDDSNQSDPTQTRRDGFIEFMGEYFPLTRIHSVFIDPKAPAQICSALDDFFAGHPSVKYVAMFNSRVHLIVDYLESHPVSGRVVIGFDDLEKNMDALRSGAVSILIAQHTEMQSFNAVNVLVDYILMHKVPPKRDNYMHMDILLDLNQENY